MYTYGLLYGRPLHVSKNRDTHTCIMQLMHTGTSVAALLLFGLSLEHLVTFSRADAELRSEMSLSGAWEPESRPVPKLYHCFCSRIVKDIGRLLVLRIKGLSLEHLVTFSRADAELRSEMSLSGAWEPESRPVPKLYHCFCSRIVKDIGRLLVLRIKGRAWAGSGRLDRAAHFFSAVKASYS